MNTKQLATQAAEYASAVASAYAMNWYPCDVESAIIWSDEAIELAARIRFGLVTICAEAWAETAARLMNGEY